ncbi:MAG: hypothetical protein CMN76_15800 [Spirochaetaceae bacterium]|nr:hypothetical protein [Spirochaetaceae bacterium]|tara:strand:+ start:32327 stop:32917 length:591 start_codon:yes stop_codon:yes gene_type:complete
MSSIKRWVAALALASVVPFAFSGCYGHFPLVRTVYKFNGSVTVGGPKVTGVVQSILMILMAVFPVYGLSFLADVIVFNLIEFWSGRPVFTAHEGPDGSKVTMRSLDQNTMEITLEKDGKSSTYYALRDKPSEIFVIRNGQWVPVDASYIDAGELRAVTVREGEKVIDSRMQLREEAIQAEDKFSQIEAEMDAQAIR